MKNLESWARLIQAVEEHARRVAQVDIPRENRAIVKAATRNFLARPSRLNWVQRGASSVSLAELLMILERRLAYCRRRKGDARTLVAACLAVKVMMRREREESRAVLLAAE